MPEQQNIIELKDLEIGYSSGIKSFKVLLQGINLSAGKGQLTAMIGRNGSGKSTLLKTIMRLTNHSKGDILIDGRSIKNISRTEFARMLAFVSTETLNISNIKVIELITLGRFPYTNWFGRSEPSDKTIVNEAIELLDLGLYSDKYFYNLSDGEKQKVMIARAIAQDTEILLLDEPTAFLDMPNKYEIISILNHLAITKKKTIIFSTHDLNIAINEADKIWLINDDLIIEGAPEDLMLNESFEKYFSGFNSFKNYNFSFDKYSITFKINKVVKQTISLNGTENHILWTKKALERIGYKVEMANILPYHVNIVQDGGIIKWKFIKSSQEIDCKTIYELIKVLQSQACQ